jgi:hypothetical protein
MDIDPDGGRELFGRCRRDPPGSRAHYGSLNPTCDIGAFPYGPEHARDDDGASV